MEKKEKENTFELFWAAYPLKVGKLAAVKAYVKARQSASADEIMTGVRNYVRTKPDWQRWAHPATWLNQGRWMDENDPAVDYRVKAQAEADALLVEIQRDEAQYAAQRIKDGIR